MTEEKIVKIVDADTTSIQASVELVEGQGAVISKIVSMPAVSVDTTGLATSAKQDDIITAIEGIATSGLTDAELRASPVVVDLGANNDITGSVTANAGTNLNTSLLALETGGNLATIAGKDFATQTTLSAINSKLVTGTDIGDVTINNGSGAGAVNIQDGGNTITVDGTITANLSATDNAVLDSLDSKLSDIKTAVEIIDNSISGSETQVDVVSIANGSNLIGDVSLQPRTSNGCLIYRSIDLDETEEDVKTSAGNLYGYYFANLSAGNRFIKIYNNTASNVVVGTTTPVMTLFAPAGSAGHVGLTFPISFDTAICIAATTGIADNDTGAPDANDVIFEVFYK